MDEARFGPDMLGQVGEEGDHVVPRLALDLVDPLDFETAALPNRLGRLLGNDAQLRHRIASMRLDLEPDAETVLRLPDVEPFQGDCSAGSWLPSKVQAVAV